MNINPKKTLSPKQHDEHARRYVFYPLGNLDFAGSQPTSPIWSPKIPKGRIVLLESFEYYAQVENSSEFSGGGVVLGQKTMGTDAQVAFLMGSNDGVGFQEKGMVHLKSLIGIDPAIAVDVEKLLLPKTGGDIKVPATLPAFRDHLNTVKLSGDTPVVSVATQTLAELVESVNTAIVYCTVATTELEKELAEGRAGRLGIKSLNSHQKYLFEQIQKPLPEDRAGINMGSELARVLAPLINQQPPTNFQNDVETDMLKIKVDELTKANEELIKINVEQAEALSVAEA